MGLITKTHFQYYNNSQKFIATANQTVFALTNFDPLPSLESEFIIRINGSEVDDNLYTYSSPNITFASGRAVSDVVIVELLKRKHGGYRYISLIDIINNYMMIYVGDGKLISTANRTEVLFHAKRGIQEFAYDLSRVEKIQELEVSTSLSVPMPQDYVHYVRLSSVDAAGVEHIIYPANYTSVPSQSILQDDDYNYLYDDDNTLLTGFPVTQDRFDSFDHSGISGDLADQNLNYNADRSAERIFNYGERFGLDPVTAQKNGVFIADELNGKFTFSSELSGKLITIKYISDGLGTDEEMKVHKYSEDAIYKYITHALASSRANYPEYIINRFRKEKRAAIRNSKIRLSNYKIGEFEQLMRGKNKRIKN